jgi:hypothetical protein
MYGHPAPDTAGMLTAMNAALILGLGSVAISLAAVVATFWGIQHTNKINREMQDDRLRFDERRQDREMLRLKGEEAFELIGSFELSFRQNLIDLTSELIKQGVYTLGAPFSDISLTESTRMRRRVELLVKTYFPTAIPNLEFFAVYEKQLSLCLEGWPSQSAALVQKTAGELVMITVHVDEHSQKLQGAIVAALQKLHEEVNLSLP